jgi:hypothetical protein
MSQPKTHTSLIRVPKDEIELLAKLVAELHLRKDVAVHVELRGNELWDVELSTS